MPSPTLKQRSLALFVFFFLPGVSMASWVTRTPAIRDKLGASTAEMGLVLFGLSIGSMAGILCSGYLVQRFSTKPVIAAGTGLVIAGILLVALGAFFSSAITVSSGLCLFGAGMGSAEIAINVEGADVERISHRPLLPMLHGCFSLGTLVGAGVGNGLTSLNFPIQWHLLLIGVICVPATLWALKSVPKGNGLRPVEHAQNGNQTTQAKTTVWRDRRLLLIGLIVLAMALAEGSANDWLPLLMVDGHGFSPTSGSLIYTGFALGMTIGRFCGGYFLRRFGRVNVVRGSAIFGVIGLGLIIFAENTFLVSASVLFWGVGASLGFPLTLSAASDTGPNPAARVSAVATTGYIAFLVGPPMLGFLGEHWGLRSAMIVVLTLVAFAIWLAPAVGEPPKSDA